MSDDKPKARVIKAKDAGPKLKVGTVTLTERSGRTFYKVPCDHCDATVKTWRPPLVNDAVLCHTCHKIHAYGRPESRVFLEKGKTLYETPCDACGKNSVSKFMPKSDRPFYCISCKRKVQELEKLETLEAQASQPSKTEPKEEKEIEPQPEKSSFGEPRVENPSTYKISCKVCKKKMELAFKPKIGERLICPDCFHRDSERRDRPKGPRVLYQIECSRCGKSETLDRVPKRPDQALCTACFHEKRDMNDRTMNRRGRN